MTGFNSKRKMAADKQAEKQELVAQYSDIVSDGGLDPRNKFDVPPQRQPEQEPVAFGSVTVRRLSQRFENHHDQYQFYPAGQPPYLDNVDEVHTVYTSPPSRQPLTDEAIATVYWGVTGQSLRPQDNVLAHNFARAIEAAHGIKGES